MRRSALSPATPEAAWALISRPDRWAEWAPHIRGAWGLAESGGEVVEGARGAVRLLGIVPVPAVITRVVPGRSWTWRVGAVVEMDHVVSPEAGGTRIAVTLRAPQPLQAALSATYGPLVGVLVKRLARKAAEA
ncbi:MAG: hypothetical protein JWM31_2160 [Solirubrobacterales bacterium]|nr:hypothetical protein [Solirubrobacterales bacterium]